MRSISEREVQCVSAKASTLWVKTIGHQPNERSENRDGEPELK